MRFRGFSAWRTVAILLAVVGIAGVPDDIKKWGEWLKMIDAWMDHAWVRLLAWAVSAVLLTYPQWLPGLRKRFTNRQFRRGWNKADAEPPIPPGPGYTMQSAEEILTGPKGRTSLEMKQSAKIHLGMRMRVSGVVENLDESFFGTISVWIRADGDATVVAALSDDWKALARTISVGSRVTVDGRIVDVSPEALILEDSYLPPPRKG